MSDTITIGPKKAANVSLLAYQAAIELPFSATVIVDGDLVGSEGGLQKASALLSKRERTIPLKGILRLTDVSEATVRTDDLQGQAGCEGNAGKLVIQEAPQASFKTTSIGLHLKSGFALLAKVPRSGISLMGKSQRFAKMKPLEDGPVIGPPDGTSYEILYTNEVAKPSIACGFNDIGVPNTGIYTVEARQYRTYVNGKLVSQHQEFVEVFKSCFTP